MFSERQLEEHMKLWRGYQDRAAQKDRKGYGTDRGAQKSWFYDYAGAILHQYFFEQFDDFRASNAERAAFEAALAAEWGSVGEFRRQFGEAALGCRPAGWMILGWHPTFGLHTYVSDTHTEAPVDSQIILILDMYEHAYFIDYGADKGSYVSDFMREVNMDVAAARYAEVTR